MYIKRGFTLAEATITLFLLSVIAGVLIPTAVNIAPNQFKTGLRNAYSLTSGTVNTLINNDTLYPQEQLISPDIPIPNGILYDTTGTKHTFTNKNEIDTYSETNDLAWEYEALIKNCECKDGPKLVRAFCCSMNVTAASCENTNSSKKCTFTTNNGMVWTATQNLSITNNNRDTTPMMYVEVDLNGSGKPNSKTVATPDQFKFNVFYNGRIEISQAANDDYYQSSLKAKQYLENPTKNKKRD